MMTSYDFDGPAVNFRTAAMWVYFDPLDIGQQVKHDFEVEVFDGITTESQTKVMVGGQLLKFGEEYTDYYGFGKSRDSSTKEAQGFYASLSGADVDITVETTVIKKLMMIDPKNSPFYSGAVRAFIVPQKWRYAHQEKPDPDNYHSTQTFEVWRNGDAGADTDKFNKLMAETYKADAGQKFRNGDLRISDLYK